MNSFLMLGQSNMAGRGKLDDVAEISDERIWMLRNGRWQPMREPINPDRPSSGVGLAASFAKAYVRTFGSDIGLIPCADGGTTIDDWAVGGQLYENAVCSARLAQRISTLSGILWHQGESDCTSLDAAYAYEGKLKTIIDSLAEALNVCDVPVIFGELGEFVGEYMHGLYKYHNEINEAIFRVSQTRPNFAFVSAQGLKADAGGIHFSSFSYRELGERYFIEYKKYAAAGCEIKGDTTGRAS